MRTIRITLAPSRYNTHTDKYTFHLDGILKESETGVYQFLSVSLNDAQERLIPEEYIEIDDLGEHAAYLPPNV